MANEDMGRALLRTALRQYYYNNKTVKENFPWLPEAEYDKAVDMDDEFDDLFFENKDLTFRQKADLKKQANQEAKKGFDQSFARFYRRLMDHGPIMDDDGNVYDTGSLKNGDDEKKRLFNDFLNGKNIVFMGAGGDDMISLKADSDSMNFRVVDGNRNKMRTPEFFKDKELKIEKWEDNKFKCMSNWDDKKPTSGRFWNWLSKKFWGQPSKKWKKYENYLKKQKLEQKLTQARSPEAKNNYSELSEQNIETDQRVGKLNASRLNALNHASKTYVDSLEQKKLREEEKQKINEEIKEEIKKEEVKEETKEEVKEEIEEEVKKEPTKEDLDAEKRRNYATKLNNQFYDFKFNKNYKGDERVKHTWKTGLKTINEFLDSLGSPDKVSDIKSIPGAMAELYLAQQIMRSKVLRSSGMADGEKIDQYNSYEQMVRGYEDNKLVGKTGVKTNLTNYFSEHPFYKKVEKLYNENKFDELKSTMTALCFDENKTFCRIVDSYTKQLGDDAVKDFDKKMLGENFKPADDYYEFKAYDDEQIVKDNKNEKEIQKDEVMLFA